MKKDIKSIVKRIGRANKLLEMLSYLIQNNILYDTLNFSGDGDFMPDPESIYNRFKEIAIQYNSAYPYDLKNKTILEIGPGRSLTSCYYLSQISQCKKVYAHDAYGQVWQDIDRIIVERYFQNVSNVHYLVGKNALSEITDKVDYIVSNAVLEHIWNLDELIEQLSEVSHKNTIMFHIIDFRNHNKFSKYGDLYFLKYSDTLWKWMASNVGHPNRLRMNNYENIFIKHGFTFEPFEVEYYDDASVRHAIDTYLSRRYADNDLPALYVKSAKVISKRKYEL